jgi:hypothetical protein
VTTTAGSEAAPWLDALGRLVPVPARHANAIVPLEVASAFLGCSQETWALLQREGFPVDGGKVERIDLVNLALASGIGASIAEVALRRAMSFVDTPRATWSAPRRWRVKLRGSWREGVSPHDRRSRWIAWRPLPWPEDHAAAPASDESAEAELVRSHVVDVAGQDTQLTPAARAVVDDFFAGPQRYARMPLEAQLDTEWMLARGIYDCLSGSLELQRRFAHLGMHARVRKGWFAGVIESDHIWLELVDVDGDCKSIDLSFHALARILYRESGGFQNFCIGSRMNRLLGTDCPYDQPLIGHTRESSPEELRAQVTITDVTAG